MRTLILAAVVVSGLASAPLSPQAALHEYAAALKDTPNRFRGLYGAAVAAQATDDGQVATDYFNKLVTLAQRADTERPELACARVFLARR